MYYFTLAAFVRGNEAILYIALKIIKSFKSGSNVCI
jgi:hypothetical protein